eukprot:813986-Rhodomonas_salina.1
MYLSAYSCSRCASPFVPGAFVPGPKHGTELREWCKRRSAQMARQRRMRVVHTLPTTAEPPPDGDVCGVCLEILANVEGVTGVTWRVLPCGHRFHAVCVDEWLARCVTP